MAVLLQWDVSAIAPGSRVTYVSITLNVTKASAIDAYRIYEMKRHWEEGTATWTLYADGAPWDAAGADGVDDRGGAPLGTVGTTEAGRFVYNLNEAGLALVQSWVDDPGANNGVILLNYAGAYDGIDFDSRETGDAAARPKLTVEIDPLPVSCFIDVVFE